MCVGGLGGGEARVGEGGGLIGEGWGGGGEEQRPAVTLAED